MKKNINMFIILCISILALTGCKKTEVVEESVVTETVDKFAVNDAIDVEEIVGGTKDSEEQLQEGIVSNENIETNTAEVDKPQEQESLMESIDALNDGLMESSKAEFINSEEEVDITLYFDRIEGDYLYAKSEGDVIEFKLYIPGVRDGVDPAEKGDLLYILYNGHTDETELMTKVYKVINMSSLEEIEAQAEVVEEDAETFTDTVTE